MWAKKDKNGYTNEAGLIKQICWQHASVGFAVGVCARSAEALHEINSKINDELLPFIKFDPVIKWIDFNYTIETSIYFEKFMQNLAKSEPEINQIMNQFIAETKEAFGSQQASFSNEEIRPPMFLFSSRRGLFAGGVRTSARVYLTPERVDFYTVNNDAQALDRIPAIHVRRK